MSEPMTATAAGLGDPAVRQELMSTVDATPGAKKPDPILVVDHIVRTFGGMTAVDVDHLEVQRGVITALIGPNGAGKTTFFNLITGFDKPTSARTGAHWSFDGAKLDKTSASSVARAGMVRTFQLTKALSRMTVMDNMMLGAQDQAGVNPALTQSLLGHIQSLRDEGMTVLFVEHDMHVVRHISDWVAVMAEGRMVAEGTADTVMADPAVIDAYLGAHHDTDLGDDTLLSDATMEQIAEEVAAEEAGREDEA